MIVLMREALIIVGMLKGPILAKFERYGDDERFYYPVPRILIAAGVFALGIGVWIYPYVRLPLMPAGPGILLFFAAYFAHQHIDFARRHPEIFQSFPRWHRELREYTTRAERRRIAYMWLDLPLKTRLLYNSSDRAFLHWADMIVLATVS